MNYRILLFVIPALFITSFTSGQKSDNKITIRGLVKDSLQRPVKGAAIFIDNKETTNVTDKHGRYKIRLNPGAERIKILSLQHLQSETTIDGRSVINFTLSGSAMLLTDSIAGHGKSNIAEVVSKTKRKKDGLSGNASIIDNKYSKYTSIYDLIRAELPEIQVTGNSILIRGYTSLTGSSQPIFVVDGIITIQIDDILPNRVRSIRVLKGQSAAIYGMRGANGVIEIRTTEPED